MKKSLLFSVVFLGSQAFAGHGVERDVVERAAEAVRTACNLAVKEDAAELVSVSEDEIDPRFNEELIQVQVTFKSGQIPG